MNSKTALVFSFDRSMNNNEADVFGFNVKKR